MIELKNVSKSYNTGNAPFFALCDINLTVAQGEIVGIIGKSGAGKSTLIRSVNLLERPSSGSVVVDGVELMPLPDKGLNQQRRRMGMIFQHFNLLSSRTAYENIALPLELNGESASAIDQVVTPLLERVHLLDRKDYYPHQLSGGQKQRVAIARALATGPKVLLCDEATSALDPESTQSVLALLKEINVELGLTILLITHEMGVIKKIADRVGVLDEGRLVEIGPVVDIFFTPKTDMAKRLTRREAHMELPETFADKLSPQGKSPIVCLTFASHTANRPIISHLQRRFDVNVSILQADLEQIQGVTVGFTLCEMKGEPSAITEALAYIETLSIKVEVLGYV